MPHAQEIEVFWIIIKTNLSIVDLILIVLDFILLHNL